LFETNGAVEAPSFVEVADSSPVRLYKYVESENLRRKIVLKNSKIELERAVKWDEYVPKSYRKKTVLEKEKNKRFFDDFNKMELFTKDMVNMFCFEICIYDQGGLIASFRTNGRLFYDNKNKLMYFSRTRENLLEKYWGVLEENHCR
jgi:hypothetical protein